jgi:hypothetical protein
MQNMPIDAIPVDCGIQRMWGVRDLTRSRLGPSIVRSFMVRSFMLSVPRIAPENTGPTLSRPPLAAADRQGEVQTLGATPDQSVANTSLLEAKNAFGAQNLVVSGLAQRPRSVL